MTESRRHRLPVDLGGHPQPNGPVTRPLAIGDRLVVMSNGDLVAEESCRAGTGMSDQRLLFRQFQSEFVTEELSEALLDLLASAFGPVKPSRVSSA